MGEEQTADKARALMRLVFKSDKLGTGQTSVSGWLEAKPQGHGIRDTEEGRCPIPHPPYPGDTRDRMWSLLVHLSSSCSCLVLPKRLPCKLPLFPRPTHSCSQERACHLLPCSQQLATRHDNESHNRSGKEGPRRAPNNTEGPTPGGGGGDMEIPRSRIWGTASGKCGARTQMERAWDPAGPERQRGFPEAAQLISGTTDTQVWVFWGAQGHGVKNLGFGGREPWSHTSPCLSLALWMCMQYLSLLSHLSFPTCRIGLLGGPCPGRVWVIREVILRGSCHCVRCMWVSVSSALVTVMLAPARTAAPR